MRSASHNPPANSRRHGTALTCKTSINIRGRHSGWGSSRSSSTSLKLGSSSLSKSEFIPGIENWLSPASVKHRSQRLIYILFRHIQTSKVISQWVLVKNSLCHRIKPIICQLQGYYTGPGDIKSWKNRDWGRRGVWRRRQWQQCVVPTICRLRNIMQSTMLCQVELLEIFFDAIVLSRWKPQMYFCATVLLFKTLASSLLTEYLGPWRCIDYVMWKFP